MKVLVTGARGQLGYDVVDQLASRKIEYLGVGSQEMDITDYKQVEKVINEADVDAVIHCAAYTAVDKAEEDEEACRKVNVDGTANIAKVCKELDLKLIYISTDYVFDGSGQEPRSPDSMKNPLNIYGQTKYEGEQVVEKLLNKYFIVRVSWVFGINGNNFVSTMLKLGKERGNVSVVNDQFGSPTYTEDLARLLVDMILTEKYGVYHATNEGFCSWYEFACEIFKMANMSDVEVLPVNSSLFHNKAERPFNSRLFKGKLDSMGFNRLPRWEDALKRYLDKIQVT